MPTNLSAVGVSVSSVSLSWSASVSVSVTGYRVFADGVRVGSTSSTAFSVAGLACGSSHTFGVAAVDGTGKLSAKAQASASTLACPVVPPPSASGIWKPALKTTWQWQITGRVDETVPAQMFDIDLFDARPGEINAGVIDRLHARGIAVVCYLDTGAWESYRPDAALFPLDVIGNSTGWTGENWLDIRPASWARFSSIVWNRLDLAKSLGCDGVEPDQNNPIGNDPGFPITQADQKAWYLEVARQAHLRGLSVGMKNGIETVDADTVAAFDWALNEECFQYRECGVITPFVSAGKAVFQVEYATLTTSFCPQANLYGFNSMRKRLALGAWREVCW